MVFKSRGKYIIIKTTTTGTYINLHNYYVLSYADVVVRDRAYGFFFFLYFRRGRLHTEVCERDPEDFVEPAIRWRLLRVCVCVNLCVIHEVVSFAFESVVFSTSFRSFYYVLSLLLL